MTQRRTALWLTAAALSVVLAVMLIVDLASISQKRAGASPAAVVAARSEAIAFFTLDYRTIDADLAKVLSLSSGDFKKQYAAKQSTVKQGVVTGKLSSKATVGDGNTAVELESASKVIVIVAVDSTTTAPKTTSTKATTETDRYRMRLTVTKVSGHWLVSSIEQVG